MSKSSQRFRTFVIGFVFQFVFGLITYHFLKSPKVYMKHLKVHVNSFQIFSQSSDYDETLSNFMFEEVKVLCMVMTHRSNHKKKASYVKRTWGRRCNKLLFLSSVSDDDLDIVISPFPENRNALWNKTKFAFNYMHRNYINEYDWFLKADDDS